ncbi:nuclear transport factor 2 family protein [Chitinophagaceae bacterium LB-8]|uniref:Nuclear transport factor 2 family protein n=1 Tax=Paraflavisolibacter caeni TaxID=2982496 RepID=A0A9X2XZQ0_9BACT|nr:nuclear transport factor 2 family protein [Paraflavisolibacter caeni]MCU7551672.1 nuclear transport factor 2 family protein [Paraflavisolibacter caeni]
MKKILSLICLAAFFASCNSGEPKTEMNSTEHSTASDKAPADLPYTASYSSSWSTNVSDADLKMVLMTYKDWASGNMDNLGNSMADTVAWDMASGDHMKLSKAELMKMWKTYRDSLNSVSIDMEGWQKMYATDKKEGYIVTWYKETDTYKTGKVDSAYYHDINQVKDGKIVWYSQYKRPAK